MRAVLVATALLALFAAWLYRAAGAPGPAPATVAVTARPAPALPPLPIAAAALAPPALPTAPAAPPPLAPDERAFLTPP